MVDLIIPSCKTRPELDKMIADIEATAMTKHKLIATCQPASSAQNRNFGLDCGNSEIVIMIDDDITGFRHAWDNTLIQPLIHLQKLNHIIMVSARCMNPVGSMASVGHCDYDMSRPISYIPKLKEGILPTSAVAFRRDDTRFDENYKGACFEDADFCFQLYDKYPGGKFVVNNLCRLIHLNMRQGYGGRRDLGTEKKEDAPNRIENRKYFHRKWGAK